MAIREPSADPHGRGLLPIFRFPPVAVVSPRLSPVFDTAAGGMSVHTFGLRKEMLRIRLIRRGGGFWTEQTADEGV